MRIPPALLLHATLLLATPLLNVAVAAPLSLNFDIRASGFSDVTGGGAPVPVDPFSLVVALNFDPTTGDQFGNSAGLRVLSSSLPGIRLTFDYDSSLDQLTFGGAGLSGIGITAGTNDLLAVVATPYSGRADLEGLIYTTAASPGIFESFTGSVSVVEPGSAGLVLSALGLLTWRRRRT